MQWLRLYSEARTDNKLRTLNDAQHRVWFNLLCYAGEQPERGEIQERDQYMLAIECSGGDEDLLVETLGILGRLRIIEYQEDGSFRFSAWESRQYDKPSDRPEATAERKRRSREKAESHAPPSNENEPSRDVTPGHAIEQIQNRTDTDAEQSSPPLVPPPGETKPKSKRATTMTDEWRVGESDRIWAIQNGFDPGWVDRETEKFIDHFKATGKPMKDWDAAWKNWMRRSREFGPARASPNGSNGLKPEERRPAIPLFEGVEHKQMSPEKLAQVRREVEARRAT